MNPTTLIQQAKDKEEQWQHFANNVLDFLYADSVYTSVNHWTQYKQKSITAIDIWGRREIIYLGNHIELEEPNNYAALL
jgi:hypothetical protein